MKSTIESLRERLRRRKRLVRTASRRAAVLIPLVQGAHDFEVILTRRTDTLSSHKGQVAFPGGTQDPDDETLIVTALREAQEEVELNPDLVDVIGLLDDIPTVTGETIVTPVVGVVDGMPELVANPAEVARIFSIPLVVLSTPSLWRIEQTTYNGRQYPLYFLEHSGETLWGLSAYVTRQLLQCMGRLKES